MVRCRRTDEKRKTCHNKTERRRDFWGRENVKENSRVQKKLTRYGRRVPARVRARPRPDHSAGGRRSLLPFAFIFFRKKGALRRKAFKFCQYASFSSSVCCGPCAFFFCKPYLKQ
ncbi:hypothetical protein EVAR_47346_1 [Eumeta japonica]|uniref:Uncharacterized protein n=1 Tax=Eumeta variegata TaxID=151549 RepID=A0A4C1WWH8_EUMVA|nr:hypothetical protein EVAR_47346_1 [Eumeta japonica]